jgi:hypothetical protein
VDVVAFWNQLHEHGDVVVERDARLDPAQLAPAIQTIDAQQRLELAGAAPELILPVAVWAVGVIHRACQFLVYRDIDAEVVKKGLSVPSPSAPSAAVCYSADLALSVLPDLHRQARGLAEDDPLTVGLVAIGRAWPLSSVGMPGIGEVDVAPFIDHPSLRRLYADRMIHARDVSRLADGRAVAAVREAIGGHPELSPALSDALTVGATSR